MVFYEKPLVIASRFLTTRQRQGPRGAGAFVRGVPDLLTTNLMIGPRVAAMLRRMGIVDRRRSSSSSTIAATPRRRSTRHPSNTRQWSRSTDWGSGRRASIAHGSRHRLTLLEEQRFPNSLGLVYSFVTAYCGFVPNSDEYKLMGLAPYGDDRFADALAEFASRRRRISTDRRPRGAMVRPPVLCAHVRCTRPSRVRPGPVTHRSPNGRPISPRRFNG